MYNGSQGLFACDRSEGEYEDVTCSCRNHRIGRQSRKALLINANTSGRDGAGEGVKILMMSSKTLRFGEEHGHSDEPWHASFGV